MRTIDIRSSTPSPCKNLIIFQFIIKYKCTQRHFWGFSIAIVLNTEAVVIINTTQHTQALKLLLVLILLINTVIHERAIDFPQTLKRMFFSIKPLNKLVTILKNKQTLVHKFTSEGNLSNGRTVGILFTFVFQAAFCSVLCTKRHNKIGLIKMIVFWANSKELQIKYYNEKYVTTENSLFYSSFLKVTMKIILILLFV